AVRLGFGRAVFHDGTAMRGAMEDHVADGAALYAAPFRLTGPEAVRRGFGEANLIPNVSAALFRRPGDLALYEAELWRGMRVCGDWLFYLNLMRGGLLAFEPGALSFYRIHGQNSSIAAHQRDDFYAEHGAIAAAIARHYGRQPDARAALLARLGQIWRGARSDPPERLGPIFADAEAKAPQSAAKQRILMLSAGFSVGGAESFAVSLANLLRRAGHSVSFLDCGLEPAQPALRARLSPDIPLLSDSSDLTAILRDFDIEIAHSHHAWVDQALLDADPAAAARVVTLHGMYETLPKAQRARLIARLGNVADGLAAPASRNLEGLAPGRGTLIANAAEPAHAAPIPRAALGVPEGAFLIALVSRAVPEKGWTEAIAATRAARSISGRDIHLLLTGAGPEHDRLKSAALPDFVHLTGLRGDVGAIFAAADLAILPSRYKGESYPMVILEALGAGTPVLASDLGQIAQMLTRPSRRAGEVIALKGWELDTESWAARIAALATGEAALALMRAAIPYLLDGGDAERMRSAYESLYQDALGRAASRAQAGSEDKE
ncbi:MAG: glycosyltransferase family 4 protein, partial [Paracoccus sp. (in: a-proteobacteria)]|nr:glycosyltransferase family 4 protein [Paracoccus sp. (in: a-proteobacteria)]